MRVAFTWSQPGRSWIVMLAALSVSVIAPIVRAADDDLQAKLDRLEKLVEQQQADLDAQRQQLARQYELIRQLQKERPASLPADAASAKTAREDASGGPALPDAVAAANDAGGVQKSAMEPTESGQLTGQAAAAEELALRQQQGTAQPDVNARATLYEPSSSVYDPDFPGAWHLPGTTAAMKIGGYVNLTVVDSLDPLVASDRFIVGSIPPSGVDAPGARAGTGVTATQTRLNFEVRELTPAGQLRAFVEGDFEAPNDSFRLRHAYGQYGWALAGKTWSVFGNVDSLPEEVDFEGINGAVLVRQPQLRIFPTVGKNLSLVVSVEDPTTDVADGIGSKGAPDFVFSVDRVPLLGLAAWNYKASVILRDLEGQAVAGVDPGDLLPADHATGWGITTSGRTSLSGTSDASIILWQLTYGEGIGRYVNDLGTIGGGDAVFDPSGRLRALPVFAGFVSYRHTWSRRLKLMSGWSGLLRSNFTLSWVDVDTYDFQPDDAYRSTLRGAVNLIYFPTQNVRLGAEFLWGERVNKDDSKGDATQVQISAKYSF